MASPKEIGILPSNRKNKHGFTLMETVIAVMIFIIVSVGVYSVFTRLVRLSIISKQKIAATALANEQLEIIRNLTYSDIGIQAGIPVGLIPHTQTLTRDGIPFTLETTIRNIDDPFDGTINGDPNDLSPADYKLVEVKIDCNSCISFQPLTFTSFAAPKNLETTSSNGALFVHVIDSFGQPVQGASIHIENNDEFPAIAIDETSNSEGTLQIVDTPPGTENYEITVTKSGFSTHQTVSTEEHENPLKPHATVAEQTVTDISFSIDELSSLAISSVTPTCTPVPFIDFTLQGSKLIAEDPPIYKYQESLQTNASGLLSLANMEWDTYTPTPIEPTYALAGSLPVSPFTLSPNATQNVQLVLEPFTPNTLLITVEDSGTSLPLAESTVIITKEEESTTLVTGRGFLQQTSWEGGSGQEIFTDETKFFTSDGNVEINDPVGEITLLQTFGVYAESGEITSSTFDTGSASNFYQLSWEPQDQPTETGDNSLTYQLASNNDQLTWNFVGPDGTSGTYYTTADKNIHAGHNGDRYIRYNIFFSTENTNYTPNLAELAFTFTSACSPPGQVLFQGLSLDEYTITVDHAGYQTAIDSITLSQPENSHLIQLSPNE
ncbi:MAG: hypothetical protein HOJ15_02360 [Candidatus Jacksonbacteria bacterium]|jgi:type II secretory pathway pseudopilin PulG|nr:hypothetical protein [Candidatus Jacksonbacteria bacterium]MBT6034656.1 hypothetical protein [Candidatus Jacksonbacteria bacterium]MBT6301248.1 hypothetical protein [Candidatus Jacksonbacteria bacterium]MBT6757598.1 hypothetical protein [Candidatus Jacksonbacteria bacterium]MBT6954960.1 hypothetical protein [Candidatus Jacksonbacteria bacterium]